MKYKIQLSMYGTGAERADVIIKADNMDQAEKIAIRQAENGEIIFTNSNESVDGWEYQIEDVEEV